MSNVIIGVDIGGTKIMTGAIDVHGNILSDPIKIPTESQKSKEHIIYNIFTSIDEILKRINASPDQIRGIGVGCTGPLDITQGVILECPQLPSMHYVPIKELIQNKYQTRVEINNDANCLIYGETFFGSCRTEKNVVGFTLGTGLGCGIVINKKIVNGARSAAGEVWASPYKTTNIEAYTCSVGVTSIYNKYAGEQKTAKEVEQLATNGNLNALKTWEEFGEHLAIPIAWSINLLDPDVVLIGGSISLAYPYFKRSLETALQPKICPIEGKNTKIEIASLGKHAGFIGAGCLII